MAAIKSDEKIREEKGGDPTERRAALLRAGKGRTCSWVKTWGFCSAASPAATRYIRKGQTRGGQGTVHDPQSYQLALGSVWQACHLGGVWNSASDRELGGRARTLGLTPFCPLLPAQHTRGQGIPGSTWTLIMGLFAEQGASPGTRGTE